MTFVAIFLILGALFFFGTPIFIALMLTSLAGVMLFTNLEPTVLIQRTFAGLDKFVLMALPFFILSANAMDVGGLSKKIINLARVAVGHIFGGIGVSTQVAATIFGSLSGSGPASVAAIGKILYPELIKSGYKPSWASALVVQSGSVSLLIPPSITLILFASVTSVSVNSLFIAGLGTGLLFAIAILVYIYIYSRRHGIKGDNRAPMSELLKALKDSSLALLVPVIIIGGIFSGIFTATEAAAVSAVYAILIGMFVYKEITFKKLIDLCIASAKTTASVMILIATSSAFAWLLTITQFPQVFAEFLNNNFDNKLVFLLALNLALIIIGMVLEPTLAIVVLSPLIFPTALALGVDPIHLGIIICFNLIIGMFTPPFGLNIFVSKTFTNIPMTETWKGLIPFIGIALLILLVITYVPNVPLFLPSIFSS